MMRFIMFSYVMARLDRATQPARIYAPIDSFVRLDGPLLRAMTPRK